MLKPLLYGFVMIIMVLSCVKEPEEMTGPTIGTLGIVSDESIKYIVEQEENIFERSYKYAKLNISYHPEREVFKKLLEDSVKAVLTTRPLNAEETAFFEKKNLHPRQYAFATSALAFITHKNPTDTAYTYEELVRLFEDGNGKVFVIENARSGITNEILRLIDTTGLPAHFYALDARDKVIDYILSHENAIGIVDWSDISDSDNSIAKEVLNSIELIGISRPLDSVQHGYLKPYQYNLQDRLYPFTRDLYFISNTGMNDVGTGFAFFISGEIGQKIILKSGLLPKFQSERVLEITTSSDIKVIK